MKTQPSLPMRIAGRPCWPAIRSLTISLSSPCRRPVFSAVRHAAPATRCVKCPLLSRCPARRSGGLSSVQALHAGQARSAGAKAGKVEHACRLLEQDPALTLERLAEQVAMSPFHFHRLFKSVTGMTPKARQQAARGQRLRTALAQGDKITDAVLAAGFPDSSSYYRKANDALGMTAKQYRKGEVAVRYAIDDCSLGRCLVAESERGSARFCWVTPMLN